MLPIDRPPPLCQPFICQMHSNSGSMNVPPEPRHRHEEVERGREQSGRRALLKQSLFMIGCCCFQLPAEPTIKNRILIRSEATSSMLLLLYGEIHQVAHPC